MRRDERWLQPALASPATLGGRLLADLGSPGCRQSDACLLRQGRCLGGPHRPLVPSAPRGVGAAALAHLCRRNGNRCCAAVRGGLHPGARRARAYPRSVPVGIHLRERVASAGARLDGHHGAAGFGAGGARRRRRGHLPGGVRPPRQPLRAPGARDRRNAAGHSLHHLRPVRHAVLRDGLRLGPLAAVRCLHSGHHGAAGHHAHHRGGAHGGARFLPRGRLRPRRRAVTHGGPLRAALGGARHPGRRYFGPRPLRGRGGGPVVHCWHRGPNPRLRRPGHLRPVRLLPHLGRAHVHPGLRGPARE